MHRSVRYSTPGRSSTAPCTIDRERQRGQRTLAFWLVMAKARMWGQCKGEPTTPNRDKRSKFPNDKRLPGILDGANDRTLV
jgi:hypothetical protein